MWRYIEGYKYLYRINEEATVQILYRDEWRNLRSGMYGRRMCVRFVTQADRRVSVYLVNLMAEHFMGGRAAHPGMIIAHKNRMVTECQLNNLKWSTMHDVGLANGRNSVKCVEKVAQDGSVIALYRSVTEAANMNYVSRATMIRYLNNRYKRPYSTDGCTFRYEDDSRRSKKCRAQS